MSNNIYNFAAQNNNNLKHYTIMKTKKTNRSKSAKANATKQMTNVVSVKAEVESPVADLPVVTTESGKVSSKDVLKAAGSLRAAVKEERRGANVTIRLIAERAAAGDAAAVDILCALCDVPRAALYSLNIDTIRAAVNAWYPFYVMVDEGNQYKSKAIKQRRVSVKPVGVWYSTAAAEGEAIENAAKRVQRGYRAAVVVDYLDQLILAAKCRAKGVTPRRVDVGAVYEDNKLSTAAVGITADEIDEAKKRRAYSDKAANVWKKDRNGFYI